MSQFPNSGLKLCNRLFLQNYENGYLNSFEHLLLEFSLFIFQLMRPTPPTSAPWWVSMWAPSSPEARNIENRNKVRPAHHSGAGDRRRPDPRPADQEWIGYLAPRAESVFGAGGFLYPAGAAHPDLGGLGVREVR